MLNALKKKCFAYAKVLHTFYGVSTQLLEMLYCMHLDIIREIWNMQYLYSLFCLFGEIPKSR